MARENPLTNYDFALARHQALMLVAGQVAISVVVALTCAVLIGAPAGLAALAGGGIGVRHGQAEPRCPLQKNLTVDLAR